MRIFRLTPGVRNLLLLTTGVFLLQRLLLWTMGPGADRAFIDWTRLVADPLGDPVETFLQVWRPFTYLLVHSDLNHLLWNMLGLWLMGVGLEEHVGERRFYRLYLAGGLGGALLALAVGFFMPTKVVGASGAVLGVMFAFIRLMPNAMFYLWLIVPVKAMYVGIFYSVLTLWEAIAFPGSGVSWAAHLGGMAGGFFVAGNRSLLEFNPVPNLQRRWRRRHLRAVPARRVSSGSPVVTIPDPPVRAAEPGLEQQVDDILDRVRREGMDSLTPQERRVLDLHSSRLRHRDRAR